MDIPGIISFQVQLKWVIYTAPIINRHSEGVAFKEWFEYLKTIVASYELRTPGHMSGNGSGVGWFKNIFFARKNFRQWLNVDQGGQ